MSLNFKLIILMSLEIEENFDMVFDAEEIQVPILSNTENLNDESNFFSLSELDTMEEELTKQAMAYGGSQNNQHMLLMPQQYRARLYFLDPETKWIDIGTGYFRILLTKDGSEHYMQILSEVTSQPLKRRLSEGEIVDQEVQEDEVPQKQSDEKPVYEILHRSLISRQTDFQRQRDTIITWQDENKRDLALSFQEHRGAQNIWFSICFLKGIQVSASLEEQANNGENQQQDSEEDQQDEIPYPRIENLSEIVNQLIDSDAYSRRRIAQAILKGSTHSEVPDHPYQDEQDITDYNNREQSDAGQVQSTGQHPIIQNVPYLNKLQDVFSQVEQLYNQALSSEDQDTVQVQVQVQNLHSLFQIYKSLLGLNERDLLEVLLSESYWRSTFGALEFDPEVFMPIQGAENLNQNNSYSSRGDLSPTTSFQQSYSEADIDSLQRENSQNPPIIQKHPIKAGFREFLENQVKFREAVRISDPQIQNAIHLSYRLQYLKDTAMARFIDDQTTHQITQLVATYQQQILEYIFGAEFERIQEELLEKMQSTDSNQKDMALKFFMEICQLLKSIQINHRFPYQCQQELTKFMTVLAQIFNIMPPDLQTLSFELNSQYDQVQNVFQQREHERPEWATLEDVYPSPDIVKQYLERPSQEDPKITQLDILKSNSIDIFYSLLMVQSNSFNLKAFLTSDSQKQKKYPFFGNLCRHMLYSPQMGLRVSICEFLKDLIAHELSLNTSSGQGKLPEIPSRRYLLSDILLNEVVTQFLIFFDDYSQDELVAKALEHSKCLVLQFLNKLVLECQNVLTIRQYFIQNKVHQKVCDLQKLNLVHVNVEIVKYLKAHLQVQVQLKDRQTLHYLLGRNYFDVVPQMYLANKNKNNLLGSCILSFFDLLSAELDQEQLYKLLKRYVSQGYHTKMFFNKDYEKDFKRINYHLSKYLESIRLEDSPLIEPNVMEIQESVIQENSLFQAAFGENFEDQEQQKQNKNDEAYNDMIFRQKILEGEQMEDNKVKGLSNFLQTLKARSISQEPKIAASQPTKQAFVRSVRSMSPVRSYTPGSISFQFEQQSISPDIGSIGAVDEIDTLPIKERSNSNELKNPLPVPRSRSKDRRSSSREKSRGDSSERRSPLLMQEDAKDTDYFEVFDSDQWLKQNYAQTFQNDEDQENKSQLSLGKRLAENLNLKSDSEVSFDSQKRQKFD